MADMIPGTVLGHEGVGIVEEIGSEVRNLQVGAQVVIPSTIGYRNCSYCRVGYHAQCDDANPHGKTVGAAFFGGPKSTGLSQGLQAEYARIPFAHIGQVRLPNDISDKQIIMLSDIFPTGYFEAELVEITPVNSVAVFCCDPVGLFSIVSAFLREAGRVFAIDCVPSRLEMAKKQCAEAINFNEEDPVDAILSATHGIGVDCIIDAIGVVAEAPQ